MHIYVIADIGANHDGQYARMLEAIDEAKHAGCDCAKFQWVSDPVSMAKRRGQAYADGYAEVYAKYLAWPSNWHEELAAHCRHCGIDYMCTCFLPEDIAIVAPHVARFKVASFEASDRTFLAAHAQLGKDVLISTGMLSHGELMNLQWYIPQDFLPVDISWLHCVSSYPAPIEAMQLAVFQTNSDCGGPHFDGLSDHSDPALTWTGALAVARGAKIIEAHLRLDETDPANQDYPHAMTPQQFAEYVRNIRFCEVALGDGEKRLQPCEELMARYRVGGAPVSVDAHKE